MMRRTAAAALIFAVLSALAAHAAGPQLRSDDLRRLDALDLAAGLGLRAALASGNPEDAADLTAALAGPARPAAPEALVGNWTCRTFKLGGGLGLIAYPPFQCRGTLAEDGTVLFEKLTGSQRVRGRVLAHDGVLTLAGVAYVAGKAPPAYADLPPRVDPAASPQFLPAPGRIEVTGPDRARILFPLPMVESSLDILHLSR